MNKHVQISSQVQAAQARARELLPILDAKFRMKFPGHGSVFDPTAEVPAEVPKLKKPTLKVASPAELQAMIDGWARNYGTPRATVDAFWFLVRQRDQKRLEAWLDQHPRDKEFLEGLLR